MEPKHARFSLFLDRLRQAPPAQSCAEAFQQIVDILIEVEDEHTNIPFDPDAWETDGRMYPPQPDNERPVEGNASVRRFRSRAHNTYIGDNGAIEIQEVSGATVIFTKNGCDGRSVWSQ